MPELEDPPSGVVHYICTHLLILFLNMEMNEWIPWSLHANWITLMTLTVWIFVPFLNFPSYSRSFRAWKIGVLGFRPSDSLFSQITRLWFSSAILLTFNKYFKDCELTNFHYVSFTIFNTISNFNYIQYSNLSKITSCKLTNFQYLKVEVCLLDFRVCIQ